MIFDPDAGPDVEFDPFHNEFTGSARESILPPEPHEPICLISYELTHILLGDGPRSRSGFWKAYRRELALNLKTNYQNYHIKLCREQLVSLGMKLDRPVYFRNDALTIEKQIDANTNTALADARFDNRALGSRHSTAKVSTQQTSTRARQSTQP